MVDVPKKKAGRPAKSQADKAETFSIRLVPELRARLEEAASKAGRSLAAEISARLDSSFSAPLTYVLIDRRMKEMEELSLRVATLDRAHRLYEVELEEARRAGDTSAAARLTDSIRLVTWEIQAAREQLSRIEAEANVLIEDLGRRVAFTAEQLTQER